LRGVLFAGNVLTGSLFSFITTKNCGLKIASAVGLLVPLVSITALSCARSPERGAAGSRSAPPILALPDGGFRVEWVKNTIPKEVRAGSNTTVSVTFKNIGTAVWLDPGSTGRQPPQAGSVRISYRWLPSGRRPFGYVGRVNLSGPLGPGQSATLDVSLSAPSTPGPYRLQFDLVQEFVAWFEAMDAPRLVVPVRVL
jgi:hypothetical protein